MSSETQREITRTFELAALKREAAMNLSGDEWARYQKIRETFEGQRRFEDRNHELEYQTRFEIARKRRIDQAGTKDRKFVHRWFGNDGFDRAAIDRQAHRDVRDAHHRVIAALEKQEISEIDALLERCTHRQELREKPRNDFDRATDRRTGEERRQVYQSPRGPTRER